MSMTKRLMEEMDKRHEIAVAIALRVGLLKHCEDCDDVTDTLENNYADAYRLANQLITDRDPLVEEFQGDRRGLSDVIKDIAQNYGEDCHCKQKLAKYMAGD